MPLISRLPVLSKQEMAALFAVVTNLKHKEIFVTAYSSGIRLDEVRMLKPGDIDSDRM